MSNNLARGQEKFIKPIGDFTSDQSCDDLQYQTGQNVNGQKRAADSIFYGVATVSTLNAVGAGSTKRIIKKIAHGARKNDVVQFTSGSSDGVSIQILSCPDADTMILAATSEFDIAIADTFDIKRYIATKLAMDGGISISTIGLATDTNQALEIAQLTTIAANTGKAQTGSFAEDQTVSTTPEAFIAPAGAFACFIETDETNTTNSRVVMGGISSSTSGIQFQPGRSEFYQGGSNISYCMESGTGKISVQWFIRS